MSCLPIHLQVSTTVLRSNLSALFISPSFQSPTWHHSGCIHCLLLTGVALCGLNFLGYSGLDGFHLSVYRRTWDTCAGNCFIQCARLILKGAVSEFLYLNRIPLSAWGTGLHAFRSLSVKILVLSNDFARPPMEPRSPITSDTDFTLLPGNCNAKSAGVLHTSVTFPSLSTQGENHSNKPSLGARWYCSLSVSRWYQGASGLRPYQLASWHPSFMSSDCH